MHPADIKAELQKRGSPCARSADRLDVPRSTVSQVVNGKASSRKVALEIARVIGKPASAIWPGRYGAKVQRAVTRKPLKRAARSVRG